jgi:hypothetical protein
LKELSWPPRITAGEQSTSLKQFLPHPLPPGPSHSQAPVIITGGRPIVILPNDYIHNRCEFLPGASLSAAFSLQPQSLGRFRDLTPAPIITPVDDDYAATTLAPVITPIDDDSPSVEHTVPARQFGGVKAIEFTNDKQCIVPGQTEDDPHKKEESTLSTGKLASQIMCCNNASKPQQLNAVQKSAPATALGATSLPKVDPMPSSDESANSTTEMTSQNPSSNSPLSLGVESGNEVQNLEQLQLPVQKSSSVRVSPLIMSCYEESKEQLVLDDSDSELEMPECSKSASCTPQQIAEQSASEGGIEDQIRNSSINMSPPKDGTLDADGPPPKRAKLMETSTTDSSDAFANQCTPADSDEEQDHDPQSAIVQESSIAVAESRENFGQAIPNQPFANDEPLEAAEPTQMSFTLASTVPDHSLKLECPHEPLDAPVSDGKDTIDQMLPMESAREHAMVPNLVRCADDNQLDDDRDESDDDGSASTHLKAYVPARDLHPSCLGSLEGIQTEADDNLVVPGQTVVEQKMETGIQVPELHKAMSFPCLTYPPAKLQQADVCIHSLAVPPTLESARLPSEHQIVPEEFTSSTTPSSSQSLYTDHDFHEKCKLSRGLQLQDECNIDDELNSPQVLAMSLDSIEKRLNIAPILSHSGDQALPDFSESPSQLTQSHYTDGGSPAGGSGNCGLGEQSGSGGQNVGPFGFRLGKKTPCHQSKLFAMPKVSNRI